MDNHKWALVAWERHRVVGQCFVLTHCEMSVHFGGNGCLKVILI
jgi:hypothetical protein